MVLLTVVFVTATGVDQYYDVYNVLPGPTVGNTEFLKRNHENIMSSFHWKF